MVYLKNLKEADKSLRILSTMGDDESFSTLCCLDRFEDKGIIFIKNERYYKKLLSRLGNNGALSTMGVVFQDNFFRDSSKASEEDLLSKFRFYATVESIDLAMSVFSKLFYDVNNVNRNDVVDGRSNDTASIHSTAVIAENVFIGQNVEIEEGVTIHAGCVILSDSTIGKNTLLYPNVSIYRDVSIGAECIIHSNTTIGSDGYRYINSGGEHLKMWHFGGVVVQDSVEVGANCSIDQGTFSPTIIGHGTKLDNQVHVAHNCKLGKGVIICGQSGLAGSVTLEDYVVLGGAVNVAPDLTIGAQAQVAGMSGVTSNIPSKAVYGGHPARPLKEWLKSAATLRRISRK